MVFTRRTAPTGADAEMPDPELALKKKPVRKATAQQRAETSTAAKPKATRTKKAEVLPVAEEPTVAQEALKPRATRGRPKKTVEVAAESEPEPIEETVEPANATPTTKAGSVRGKQARVAVDDVPELPAPEQTKSMRQTRNKTAKAAPLSPKKITQVGKPPAKRAKAAGQKASAKPAPAKASVRVRATTRGRKVSDENAEVPELPQPHGQDESVILVSSTPVKKQTTRSAAARKQPAEEIENSMSTRDTTPTASPAPSQRTEAESQAGEASASFDTPEKQGLTTENDDSDDELCGPKTPMRRGSPGAEARYHLSARRTIRKYNEEQRMQTPARRYAVLGSQRGTPQTQKPYCKPAPPSSEVRPMTVARGANRAYVFRDLREGAPDLPRLNAAHQDSIAEEEDFSFIPDDNIISMGEAENARLTTPTSRPLLQLASPPTSSAGMEGDEDVEDDDSLIQADDDPVYSSLHADHHLDMANDADATIITDDTDDVLNIPSQPESKSFETEDTVIITRPAQAEETDATLSTVGDNSEDSVIHHVTAASTTPETMVWENIQPEQPIAVNFDEHLSDSRTLPEPEPTERLDIASTLDEHLKPEEDTDAGAEQIPEHVDEEMSEGDELPQEEAEVTSSQTPTVNFNDYFDMNAITEQTQVINFAPQPVEAADTEMQDAAPAAKANDSADDSFEEAGAENEAAEQASTGNLQVENEQLKANTEEEEEVRESAIVEDLFATENGDDDVAVEEAGDDSELPHYARSTFAFDGMFTPVKTGTRPNTSDGASMPRVANPFSQTWWARSRANSIVATEAETPHRSRPSAAHSPGAATALHTPSKAATPAAKERYPVFVPRQNNIDHSQSIATSRFRDVSEKTTTKRQTFHRAMSGKTQSAPTPKKPSTPAQRPKERYPLLGARGAPVDHSQTVAPVRFQNIGEKPGNRRQTFHRAISGKTNATPTPSEPSSPAQVATPAQVSTPFAASPKERYPVLGSRPDYVDHAMTAAPPTRFQEPKHKAANRRQTFHQAMSGKGQERKDEEPTHATSPDFGQATPVPQQTPVERFPRRRPQGDYHDHAQTVAAPRFHTPAKSPLKRPATTQKPMSMRKAALRNNSSTPMKTPLKAPATTPGQEPMTPHPSAPLHGVVALVEVYTLEGASASAPFTALLHRLGAKTIRTWTDHVTHVVFKDGSPTTLQRVRLHNKDVEAAGRGTHIFCVNSRWVSDCDTASIRGDEDDEAYAVDVEEVPRGGKRRRKSMEPSALKNLGGNVVRDRRSSLGRSSLGRSSIRFSESLAKKAKIEAAVAGAEDKENSDEEPATPAWIAQPNKLVQQTAPMKRVRKLELQGKQSRRLTFWEGGN